MHRFPSSSTVLRIRLASCLVCVKCLLAPITTGTLAYALLEGDQELTVFALGLGALTILTVILQWLIASRTPCPLCSTSVLADKSCSKHRKAQALCGSYRLRVALGVLFKGTFLCPYCHERSVMKTRLRRG